jgi:hypothetical protein
MHGSQSASQVRWQTVDSARRFWPNVNHNGFIISGNHVSKIHSMPSARWRTLPRLANGVYRTIPIRQTRSELWEEQFGKYLCT